MKTIKVEVSNSTYRWLTALADANNWNKADPPITPAEILKRAADSFVARAGRSKPGSWDDEVSAPLLLGWGIQNCPTSEQIALCKKQDLLDRIKANERAIAADVTPAGTAEGRP